MGGEVVEDDVDVEFGWDLGVDFVQEGDEVCGCVGLAQVGDDCAGGDVEGCDAVLVDDMIDTAGTICQAALAVKQHGAKRVFVLATHPVLSGPAIERLASSVIEGVIVSDTIPLSPLAAACDKITVVSTAAIFAQAIQQIHGNGSVSSLFPP